MNEPIGQEKAEKPRCPNCGKKLKSSFKYCPKCGQRVSTHRTSLGILVRDMVREELHLNNKFLRTFRDLLQRPGALTLAYMQGRKKSMLSPTKLFLWTGFLFVALLVPSIEALQIREDGSGPIQFNLDGVSEDDLVRMKEDANAFEAIWINSVLEANEHPDRFVQNSLRKIPVVLLFIIPLFALLLKLTYLRRRIYYLEHLVFLLHFHAVVFLVFSLFLIVQLLLGSVGSWAWTGILLMGGYFLLSMRRVYGHSWGAAVGRTVLLFTVYLITVPLTLLLLTLLAGLLF